MLRLAFVVSLGLLATASATILPVLARDLLPSDLEGTWTINGGFSRSRCPRLITHSGNYADGDTEISHTDITMINSQCEEGTLSLQPNADAINAAIASFSDTAKTNAEQLLVNVQQSGASVLYSIENSGRDCGNRAVLKFEDNTIIVFLKSEGAIRFGTITIATNKRVMIVFDPTEPEGSCFYTAPITTTMSATPTPSSAGSTPSPSVSAVVTGDPSPSASPIASSSPGVSSDASPSPSPSTMVDVETTDDPEVSSESSTSPSPSNQSTGTDLDASPTAEAAETVGADQDEDAASPTTEEDDGVCFPADATVQLEDGSVKRMDEVELGDRLLVADGVYSDVFLFSHRDANSVHSFVKMTTAGGRSVSATSGHYLYINNRLATASTAKVGDVLETADGSEVAIEKVEIVRKSGLYNPQTLHGDVVVDTIRASTFTHTVELGTAQALMAPLRMLYSAMGMSATFLDKGANVVASYLPKGHAEL